MSDDLGRHSNTCPKCKGKGSIMVVIKVVNNEPEVDHEECSQCKGKGFVVEDLDSLESNDKSSKNSVGPYIISLCKKCWSVIKTIIKNILKNGAKNDS